MPTRLHYAPLARDTQCAAFWSFFLDRRNAVRIGNVSVAVFAADDDVLG